MLNLPPIKIFMPGAGGYIIEGSALFDGVNQYDQVSLSGMSSTFTISYWVKQVDTPAAADFHFIGLSQYNGIAVRNTNDLSWYDGASHNNIGSLQRDYTAWTHYCLVSSSGSGTLYKNGVEIASSLDTSDMASETGLQIGAYQLVSLYAHLYMTEFYYINASAPAVSTFGEFDAYGIWVPKEVSGVFGNGASSYWPDLSTGTDQSGNGNDLTVNNSPTSSNDVPTDFQDGLQGNFAVMSPLDNDGWTLSNGNLTVSSTATTAPIRSTLATPEDVPVYWEVTIDASSSNNRGVGLMDATESLTITAPLTSDSTTRGIFVTPSGGNDGKFWDGSTTSSSYTTFSNSDVIMFARNGTKLWIGKNGTWLNSGDPAAGTGEITSTLTAGVDWMVAALNETATGTGTFTFNFGATAFAHTVPTDFKSLNTANIPTGNTTTSGTNDEGDFVYTGGSLISVTWDSTTYTKGVHDGSVIKFYATGFIPQSGAGNSKAWTAVIETDLGVDGAAQVRAEAN